MKRLTAWLTGVAGGMAAYRLFKRIPHPAPVTTEPDPADELRAKIAESKAQEPEPPAAEPEPEASDPDARRRAVHERGRAAIDEMHGEDPD
jgi:hypothetical protein